MLSVEPLKSAEGAANYYSASFNYYASDATAQLWLGQGALRLQLEGAVEKESLIAFLEGKLPDGQILQNLKGEHRPGFDMTFSAPKSVSLLVGLGAAPELERYHDEAVRHAIGCIEQEFAQTRVSRDGEIVFEKTGNLLVAAFRQPSSRANDPDLHTHCVTMNITFHDGKARSLASDTSRQQGVIEQIQNNAHYCGLMYRQHLANSLKDAGFQLRTFGKGLFEIDGIPEHVLQSFSTRRGEIKAQMAENGWEGAKSASIATLLTRNHKEEHDLDKLKEQWQEKAETLGFDAEQFVKNRHSLEQNSLISTIRKQFLLLVSKYKGTQQDLEKEEAKACLHVAIESLSQRMSIFSKRQLFHESMKHSLGSPNPISQKCLNMAIQAELKAQNLYESTCHDSGQKFLTTPWLLTMETETIARIEYNKGVVPAIAVKKDVLAFQKERSPLMPYPMTDSQKEAMMVLLTNNDRFIAIQGYAGVAKTSMLSEAKLLIAQQGYNLRGVTVASSAAHELQTKAGIRSDVFPIVHQEFKNAASGSLSKTILILDEASMLSSHQGHELIKHVERTGARLVLVGDKAQLPSVNTGRIFSLTQEYGIQTTIMDEIVRQKNTSLKEAVVHATRNEIKEAFKQLDVVSKDSHDERIQWIANHWLSLDGKKRGETLLFAPTHANRESITHILRRELKNEGSLTGECYSQITLKAKAIEAVQQRFVAYYQKGDVLRFNQKFKQSGIKQGQYYTIGQLTKVHHQKNILPLIDEQGNIHKFALKKLPQYKTHTAPFERIIELYKSQEIELLKGDKVMWTRNSKVDDIRNGASMIVKEIQKDRLIFTTKEGKDVSFDKSHPALKHLDYSYVLTNYKVQGQDAPYAIGLMESYHQFSATLKNFYVQISRAIQGMILVTDNKEALIEAIKRNNDEKSAVLDVISKEQLSAHETRYISQNGVSIAPVIEKKSLLESSKFMPNELPKNQINELVFSKGAPLNLKRMSKELEL